MSIFGSIMSKIFGGRAAAEPVAAQAEDSRMATAAPTSQPTQSPAATPQVDVGAVLAEMAGKSSQTYNYKQPIVDLMKLLGLDSSLEARKALAAELHYTGDTSDSAAMNMWLHKQVMSKLAENGGVVPAELRD